ncbi:MAG: EamA family transporter RarD, partial [Synergistota bacterium]|nr:EamA family transporter RarD [Synergistota bacterium]
TYGLIRKTAMVEALPGLFIETLILTVPAAWYLIASSLHGAPVLAGLPVHRIGLLMATGVITSLPLVWFAFGARRLRLVTVGILQYIAPTLTFFLGIFFFHEALSFSRMATFTCIWLALALYSTEGLRYSRLQSRENR